MKTREVYTPEYAQQRFLRKRDGVVYHFGVNGDLYAPDSRGAVSIRINEEWEIVREPVDFMTAMNSGKPVKPESNTYSFGESIVWLEQRSMTLGMINEKWLIE